MSACAALKSNPASFCHLLTLIALGQGQNHIASVGKRSKRGAVARALGWGRREFHATRNYIGIGMSLRGGSSAC
jgi:hypothetical protein